MERVNGIEPSFEAWEAPVLPLNYTRWMAVVREFTTDGGRESPPDGRGMMVAPESTQLTRQGLELGYSYQQKKRRPVEVAVYTTIDLRV